MTRNFILAPHAFVLVKKIVIHICFISSFLTLWSCGKKAQDVKNRDNSSPVVNQQDPTPGINPVSVNQGNNSDQNPSPTGSNGDQVTNEPPRVSLQNVIRQNDIGVIRTHLDILKRDDPSKLAGGENTALYLAVAHKNQVIIKAIVSEFINPEFLLQNDIKLDAELTLLIEQGNLEIFTSLLNIIENSRLVLLNDPDNNMLISIMHAKESLAIKNPHQLIEKIIEKSNDVAFKIFLIHLAPYIASLETFDFLSKLETSLFNFPLANKLLIHGQQRRLMVFQMERLINEGDIETLQFLDRLGLDLLPFVNQRIITSLFSISDQDKKVAVSALIFSLAIKGNNGADLLNRALFLALEKNQGAIVELIIELNLFNINLAFHPTTSNSAIAHAALFFNWEMIELLKTNGATTDVTLEEYRSDGTIRPGKRKSFCSSFFSRGFKRKYVTPQNRVFYDRTALAMHCY